MKLHDPSFIAFDGTPITGRVPPQLWVAGGDLDAFQKGGVAHAYKLFCDAKATMLGTYLVQHRKLADGTSIRMMSNNGVDSVMVWPEGDTDEGRIADMFLAVPGYSGGVGYDPFAPKFSAKWNFTDKKAAPTSLKPARRLEDFDWTKQHPGNLTWWNTDYTANKKPMILSWYGRATRYGRLDYYGRAWQHHLNTVVYQRLYGPAAMQPSTQWKTAFKSAVWLNGVRHRVVKDVVGTENPVPVPVMSAALKREDDVLNLHVVSFENDNTLAVYKGSIEPLSGATVKVERMFGINFKIDTSYANTYRTNPHWETLVQPLYFNKSCTRLAGLVSVRRNSTINPSAGTGLNAYYDGFFVKLIEVDIAAGSTTFTNSHVKTVTRNAITERSDEDNYKHLLHIKTTSYGAVDFKGDELVIALATHEYKQHTTMTGESPSTSFGTEWHKEVRGLETAYRISTAVGDVTLAEKSTPLTAVGELFTTSTRNGPLGGGVGSGYRKEQVSAAFYVGADVIGGDLRHDIIHVGEFLEVGDSEYDVEIAPNAGYTTTDAYGNTVPWTSGWGPRRDGAFGGEDPYFADYMIITAVNVNRKRRKPGARISVWKGGAEYDASDYWENTDVGVNCRFSPNATLNTVFPTETFSSWREGPWFWYSESYDQTTERPGYDGLPNFAEFSLGSYFGWNPFYGTGRAYINVSAATPEGDYWFYNVGPFWAFNNAFSTERMPHGTTFPPDFSENTRSAFVINGTKKPMNWRNVVKTGYSPAASSPIFLYQVPGA